MTDAAQSDRANPPDLLSEVRAGLAKVPRELPPKLFYDARGSELFEEITRLPEYYLTRAERALLEAWAPDGIAALRPRCLVELGAGSAAKTRIILDAMREAETARCYVPLDVSAAFLEQTAADLRADYPDLEIRPEVADIGTGFTLPAGLPHPVLYSFLGSTIGNFDPGGAVHLLRGIRDAMTSEDRFLMGVDLRKDARIIEAAYNDARGVTAEFNRNMLHVLNYRLGADFDPAAYDHRAFYNRGCHCVEMHLVAREDQDVHIPGIGGVHLAVGESIRTEISCKHDRDSIATLLAGAGLRIGQWRPDAVGMYALVLGVPVEEGLSD